MAGKKQQIKLATAPAAALTQDAPIVSTRVRATVDTEAQAFSALLTNALLSPLSADDAWSLERLDSQSLRRLSPTRLLELLADLSPEVSSALWQFLRMANPGYTAVAMRPSGKIPSGGAHQKALDDFIATLNARYGAIDVPLGRLFLSAFLRGGLMAELVLDRTGRQPLDLATPDPATARWKRIQDAEIGPVWQLGQWQGGEFVPLDRDTIRYVPIDPLPGHPEGRALAAPSLFAAVFLLAMLHDIRRVIQQQGYPRIDISIDLEKLAASMPAQARTDPETFKKWVSETIRQVEEVYSRLQPDDAYIHSSPVSVNRPVGTVDASSLAGIGQIIEVCERMITRALKTMPLLMATNQTGTETQSNREWEVFVQGIKSIQHLAEGLLEHLMGLALRAQGLPAIVQWRFAEVRAAELFRDAQVEEIRIRNTRAKYDAGWISQDQAALEIVGHKADATAPRSAAGGSQAALAIGAGDKGNES
jgi:hypothetical protein